MNKQDLALNNIQGITTVDQSGPGIEVVQAKRIICDK